ncbi:MAG: hypothetical protein US50_C0001G0017 [Candidatus Nomurabacteria bacterium GW2011_GWB1_37_5]|uniref:PIN domain-containing protein n=1 Tax=Candidatus Nomurabacteria bacterium GW2011_GWB1_37_5 TaxID=1618742 RepID=A0A0G0HBS7_9BACT|nr:MAG: hypothetical protein US50_C0001G0017 [Candidatus Nomurabacteria bacterium GW2011_GWB1_37_5]
MYLLDTNSIIYFLTGDKNAVSLISELFLRNEIVYVPTIVRLELLSKPGLLRSEHSSIMDFLNSVREINLDTAIADLAAEIRRTYKLKVADSIIAATTLYTGSTLVTRNGRDFKNIQNFNILAI